MECGSVWNLSISMRWFSATFWGVFLDFHFLVDVCLRCFFYGLHHGKSPFFTTICENIVWNFFPSIFSKSELSRGHSGQCFNKNTHLLRSFMVMKTQWNHKKYLTELQGMVSEWVYVTQNFQLAKSSRSLVTSKRNRAPGNSAVFTVTFFGDGEWAYRGPGKLPKAKINPPSLGDNSLVTKRWVGHDSTSPLSHHLELQIQAVLYGWRAQLDDFHQIFTNGKWLFKITKYP